MESSAHVSPSRLERLLRYLEDDPANAFLLADAFEEALACGRHDAARAQLDAAQRAGMADGDWTFRSARLSMATGDAAGAIDLLTRLQSEVGEHPVLVHDIGHAHLVQGRHATCCALIAPWVRRRQEVPEPPAETRQALQVLWLRALHGQHRLEDAWAWTQEMRSGDALLPAAAGVAALVAVDRSDFSSARCLADEALAAGCASPEALVARASVALAERDSARAIALLQPALAMNARDGRILGLLGMAHLLARDLASASVNLEQAVAAVPEHIGTWHALGWTRLLSGERAHALHAFEQALARDRNFAESHGAVGLLHAMEGRCEAALRHLELAARLDPANVTGRYARAWLAGEAGPERLHALAHRLLDRPGFFEGKLRDSLPVESMQPP